MEWWDDDPELLGATLGMLAAWHGSGDAHNHPHNHVIKQEIYTPSSSSSDGDSRAVVPTSGSRRNVNVSRERRKQELESLRRKVAELQRELGDLRDRRAALLQPHFHDRELVSTAPVWENMATRQFQARKKAEVRNAKLKLQLEAQVRVAQDLMRMLQHAVASNPAPTTLVPVYRSVRLSREDHRARVRRLAEQWTEAFTRSPKLQNHGALPFFDVHVVDDDGVATVVDVLSSHVVPFSVERVEDVMWGLLKGDHDEDDGVGRDEKWEPVPDATDENMLTIDFTSTSTVDGGTLTGSFMALRFRADESRLIISHSFTEPNGFQNELDTANIEEDAWTRIADAHTLGHTHLPPPLTVIQHVRRLRIAFNQRGAVGGGSPRPPANRIHVLTQWFAKQIEDELAWAQQTLENTLMDATCPAVVTAEDGARR